MVRLKEDLTAFGMKSKGGEMLRKRPADGSDGSRGRRRHSCKNA